MPVGGLADVRAGAAVHREPVAVLAHDLDGTLVGPGLLGEQGGEADGVRAADGHPGTQPGAGEVHDFLVGGEAALPQRDDPVGRPSRFLGVARAEQDGAALARVRAQDPVHPAAFTGGEPRGGVVEDQGVRVGQQRAGEAQSAVQAAREGAQAFVAQAEETDHIEDLVGAPHRHTGRGTQHAELAVDRARGMAGYVTEKYADLARRMGDPMQRPASEIGDSSALPEFEHELQRRGLARTRSSEEGCDVARARLEGHVVDGGPKLPAGVAGQSDGLDHSQQDSATFTFFRAPDGRSLPGLPCVA